MLTASGIRCFGRTGLLTAVLLLLVGTSPVLAQSADFESMLLARDFSCLLEHDNTVLGGLDGGGMVVWDPASPGAETRWFAGDGLSGNFITDLTWSGRFIWAATLDGGLTRIDNPGPNAQFRQYTSNLGSLAVTAVTGAIIGGSEWVYYGMDNGGVGRIVDGISGAIYTADQDGLIDDNVTAVQVFQGDLFVGTPVGISRFANNIFTDQNTGLDNLLIHTLSLDADGDLLAGTDSGVYSWNAVSETWTRVGTLSLPVHHLNASGDRLWALARLGNGVGVLLYREGGVWTTVDLPLPLCHAMYAGTTVWVGGPVRPANMTTNNAWAWYGRMDPDLSFDTWQMDASLVANAEGITYGTDGLAWIGSHTAQSLSKREANGWTHLYEVATVANDSTGLFNHYANILAMATGTDGTIYAGQYSSGLLALDTVTGSTDHITQWNSGLNDHHILNLVVHPDGPLIVMHDWQDEEKVEVLTDPANWQGPENWITLPRGSGGLGTGPGVWDALVERRDVIWFAVQGVGLVRWDVNGDFAGPDDPLTWHDFSDDRWDDPVSNFSGTANDPKEAVSLALGPDGLLWAGGNGVTRFHYDSIGRDAEVADHWSEKASAFEAGLISGTVKDLAIDRHGDAWVATWVGLNRIRLVGSGSEVDAWLDVGNYFANPAYGLLYSPNVLTTLPGGNYRKLVVESEGRRLLLSSDRGAVEITVGDKAAVGGDPLSALYLYPNPYHPARGEGVLNLGGVTIDRVNDDAATVEIYNVEGQLVYRFPYANSEDGFWSGTNRKGNPVVTGMYVVKIMWNGATAIRSLAVVR